MTEEELYQKIIAKYPVYSKIPRAELLQKIYEKHPQYRSSIDAPQPSSFGIGPMAIGSNMGRSGLVPSDQPTTADIPYVAAKGVSGLGFGIPERIAKNPVKFGMAGISGVANPFLKSETEKFFPKPTTKGGERLGSAVETLAGFAPILEIASNIPKMASGAFRRFGNLDKNAEPLRELSRNLYEAGSEARKVAGATQGGHLDVNAADQVDLNNIQRVIDELPPKVQQTIFEDPAVERIGDMISPSLKNSEIIRGHIRNHLNSVDFTSKAPIQQAYNRVGEIMTEGQPALREAMEQTGKTITAQEKINSLLRTPEGVFKSPIGLMRKKVNPDYLEHIRTLGEQEPRVIEAFDKIRKFGEGVRRSEAFGKFAGRVGRGAALTAGGGLVGLPLLKLFGGGQSHPQYRYEQ